MEVVDEQEKEKLGVCEGGGVCCEYCRRRNKR